MRRWGKGSKGSSWSWAPPVHGQSLMYSQVLVSHAYLRHRDSNSFLTLRENPDILSFGSLFKEQINIPSICSGRESNVDKDKAQCRNCRLGRPGKAALLVRWAKERKSGIFRVFSFFNYHIVSLSVDKWNYCSMSRRPSSCVKNQPPAASVSPLSLRNPPPTPFILTSTLACLHLSIW